MAYQNFLEKHSMLTVAQPMQNIWNFMVGKSSPQEIATLAIIREISDPNLETENYGPKSEVSWIIRESWQHYMWVVMELTLDLQWYSFQQIGTCQCFLSQRHEIFILTVTGVSKNVPSTTEDLCWHQNIAENVQRCLDDLWAISKLFERQKS